MGKSILHRTYRYVRYDIREILFPSSIPNPPGYVPPPGKTLRQKVNILTSAVRLYIDSWDSKKVEAQLRRERGEPDVPDNSDSPEQREEDSEELKLLSAELKDTAKGGAHILWPHLQQLYKTRAKAYREAVKQFIEGYKEGFQEANKPEVPPEVAEEMAQKGLKEQESQPSKDPPASEEMPKPEPTPHPKPKRRKELGIPTPE